MRQTRRIPIATALAVGILLPGLWGCGGHNLAEYDFADRTLAVVYFGEPIPELWTGDLDLGADNPLEMVVNAGGRVAREIEGRRARARLDSAASRIDLAERMADRTLERARRYLGTRPVETEAEGDYIMEVDIRRMGLDASGRAAYLFVRGEAILLDGRTGREIWDADISGRDRLTPGVWGTTDVVGDIVTVGTLGSVSVDEFERLLTSLTDFVADRISRELREDLRGVRD